MQVGQEGFFGNLHHRMMVLDKAGDVHDGHEHAFDHTTFLTNGAVRLRRRNNDGSEAGTEDLKAPCYIEIRANQWHEFTATEDGVVFWCIFVVRDLSGKPVNPDIEMDHV